MRKAVPHQADPSPVDLAPCRPEFRLFSRCPPRPAMGPSRPTKLVLEVLQELATARDQNALAGAFIDGAQHVIGADIVGMYVFGEGGRGANAFIHGVADEVLGLYEAIGRPIDPILRTAVATCRPVHQDMVLGPGQWHTHPLYREVACAFPLEHYLVAPILVSGQLVGTLNLARKPGRAPFALENLLDMAAIAGQLAMSLHSLVREAEPGPIKLTPREQEIVSLVAKGCTNGQIAALLGITQDGVKQAMTRLFIKYHVGARAELVATVGRTI
jgi:DNA-binding CsgD family transcriptional regulator